MRIYILVGLTLSFLILGQPGSLKSIQLHQSCLYKKYFNGMTASKSNALKAVFKKPLLRANADFIRYAANDYLTITKVEGILSVLYRRMETQLSVHSVNQPFFWMDTKSYLFHKRAKYTDGSVFACPDIQGVFAPNFLISCTPDENIQDFVKQDMGVISALKAISQAHDIPEEVIMQLYAEARGSDEHLCLTQIAIHRSLAQRLLYAIINKYGNSLMENAVPHAFERRDMYLKNPLQYNNEQECGITLTRREENFEHRLQVKHYFCDSVEQSFKELL